MIRWADFDDIPAVVELGAQFFAESPHYCEMGYAPRKIAELIERLIENPDGYVRVVEVDGAVVGIMIGMAAEHWASEAYIASELGLFVQPGARGGVWASRLVGDFLAWGAKRKCVRCIAGTSTGVNPELCAKLYERHGFKRHAIGLEFNYQ